jgi:hypothetical protein
MLVNKQFVVKAGGADDDELYEIMEDLQRGDGVMKCSSKAVLTWSVFRWMA